MKYSRKFKESVLKKVIPPENRSVPEVAKEMGLSEQTIYNWRKQLKDGRLNLDEEESPSSLSVSERFGLLLESLSLCEEEKGKWLREKGLHSEHLRLWEQEFREQLKDKDKKMKQELAALKKQNKALQKDLKKKNEALAEVTTLLALKKKAELLWGEKEDD